MNVTSLSVFLSKNIYYFLNQRFLLYYCQIGREMDSILSICISEKIKSYIFRTNNVILQEIIECSVSWPNYKNCVSLTFSVPIELENEPDSPWSGYQLTSEHLQIMWNNYAKKYLKDGLYIYNPPDPTPWLKFQLILFSSVTLIFVICLIAIRQISIKISKKLLK